MNGACPLIYMDRPRSYERRGLRVKRWSYPISVLLFVIVALTWISEVQAQSHSQRHDRSSQTDPVHDHQGGDASGGWEGSSEGIAYSEFNHHFAGLCDVLFGLLLLVYSE